MNSYKHTVQPVSLNYQRGQNSENSDKKFYWVPLSTVDIQESRELKFIFDSDIESVTI